MRSLCVGVKATNLNLGQGSRLVEIALIETENHSPTGRVMHEFFDPGRPSSQEAEAVHGLTRAMLSGKPRFFQVMGRMRGFIGGATMWTPRPGYVRGLLDSEIDLARPPVRQPLQVEDCFSFLKTRIPLSGNNFAEAVEYLKMDFPRVPWRSAISEAAKVCALMARAAGVPEIPVERLMMAGNESRVRRPGLEPYYGAPVDVSGDAVIVPPRMIARPEPPAQTPPSIAEPSLAEADVGPELPGPLPQPPARAPFNGGPALLPREAEHRHMIGLALKTAIDAADSFRDLIGRAMRENLSVRPSLGTRGQLMDIVWRFRETAVSSEDAGLPVGFFSSGKLEYRASADASFLEMLRDAYDDFHLTPEERAALLRALDEKGPATDAPASPAPRSDDAGHTGSGLPETDRRFADAILGVNAQRPVVSPRSDIYDALPGGRDAWSAVPRRDVIARAEALISANPVVAEALARTPEDRRMNAFRWVCRGLSPEHALCMVATRALRYRHKVPPEVIEAAKSLAGTDGPKLDAPRETGATEKNPSPTPDIGTGNDRIDREIRKVNELPPSSEKGFYSGIRMGDHRDAWSRSPADLITGTSDEMMGGATDMIAAISSMEARDALGLRRWICRGLDPDHAVCMTVALMTAQKKIVPEALAEMAERLETGKALGPFPA